MLLAGFSHNDNQGHRKHLKRWGGGKFYRMKVITYLLAKAKRKFLRIFKQFSQEYLNKNDMFYCKKSIKLIVHVWCTT